MKKYINTNSMFYSFSNMNYLAYFCQKIKDMSKSILFIICVILVSSSMAQNIGQTGDTLVNYTDINGLKQGYWDKKYDNGKTEYEAYFIDGKPVGEYKRYNNKGDLTALLKFSEKSDSVKAKLYHTNGKVAAFGNYISKKKDSVWNYLDDSGICYLVESYNNGKKHGAFRKYTSERVLIEEMNWRNDVKHGNWNKYYENGKIMFEATYINGVLSGALKTYYKSGVLQKEGTYKNDLMDGQWFYYNENGGLDKMYQFDNGVCPEAEQDQNDEYKELMKNKDRIEGPQNSNDIDWLRGNNRY